MKPKELDQCLHQIEYFGEAIQVGDPQTGQETINGLDRYCFSEDHLWIPMKGLRDGCDVGANLMKGKSPLGTHFDLTVCPDTLVDKFVRRLNSAKAGLMPVIT